MASPWAVISPKPVETSSRRFFSRNSFIFFAHFATNRLPWTLLGEVEVQAQFSADFRLVYTYSAPFPTPFSISQPNQFLSMGEKNALQMKFNTQFGQMFAMPPANRLLYP